MNRIGAKNMVAAYNKIVQRPCIEYVIWPLQFSGIGNALSYQPVPLCDGIVFQGAVLPGNDHQWSDVHTLVQEVQARQLPWSPVISDDPKQTYLYVSLADDNIDEEAFLWQSRVNLFLMPCALRLSSSGDIAATQSCVVVDPVELLHTWTRTSGDIPSPLPKVNRGMSWPQLGDKTVGDVLDHTKEIYSRLSGIKQLKEDVANIPLGWSSHTDVVHTIVKSPFTVNVSVETWLGFALQFLEYTYTRTDLEGIIHCWAILEALFTHPNETTSIDQRNHYRGTSEKIAIRALILEAPKDTRSQQNFYNKVRQVADTRNLLAHGKTRGTRKVLPPQFGEVQDTVRRCLLNVIQWC